MPNFPIAVAGPQAPSYAAPLIDFSPLADLGNKFYQGAQNRSQFDASQALKGGIPLDADGQPDYAKAAQMLAQTGNIDAVSKIAQIGAQRRPGRPATGAPPTAAMKRSRAARPIRRSLPRPPPPVKSRSSRKSAKTSTATRNSALSIQPAKRSRRPMGLAPQCRPRLSVRTASR